MKSVPLPTYLSFGRCACACGQRFGNESRYQTHWRSEHESSAESLVTMADDRDQTGIADLIDDMLAQGLSCPLCGSRQPHRHTGVEIVCYQNGIKWARNSQRVSALEPAEQPTGDES